MQLDPLPEKSRVTIFMEGLHTGVARTKFFRVHPSTLKEAVDIALSAEFIVKAARYGTHGYAKNLFDRAEPMDLSHADDEEAELQAVEQQCNIRRCDKCGSAKQLHSNCPLRRPRQNRPSRYTSPNQKPGTARENVDF